MNKKKKGIIYSTNPDFEYEYKNSSNNTPDKEQTLAVCLEKHHGKTIIIVRNITGSKEYLKKIAKKIKVQCGVGGSVKKEEILIQGNVRSEVIKILEEEGYKCKKVGG